MVVTIFGERISCAKAVKGADYARLLDENGSCIFEATHVTDFSLFSLEGGEWSEAEASESDRLAELEEIVAGLLYGGEAK